MVLDMVPNVRNRTSAGLPVVGVATGGHFLTTPIGNAKAKILLIFQNWNREVRLILYDRA